MSGFRKDKVLTADDLTRALHQKLDRSEADKILRMAGDVVTYANQAAAAAQQAAAAQSLVDAATIGDQVAIAQASAADAVAAKTGSENARNDAQGFAGDAQMFANEAESVRDDAITIKSDIEVIRDDALDHSNAASGHRDAAESLKNDVSGLALQVASDKTAAQSAAAGASAVSGLANLSEAARAIVLATDVTAFFPYDTTKDSDGGAWRQKVAHTSWMNETLGTATRGTRAEFPSKALIVARGNRSVTIYDADDPACPMWGVNLGHSARFTWAGYGDTAIKSLAARNGIIYVGSTGQSSRAGLAAVDLVSAHMLFRRATSSPFVFQQPIHAIDQSYEVSDLISAPLTTIPNQDVNSIATTVLPHTPPNPLRCDLPNPTVGVGTSGGPSLIRHDGVVCNGPAQYLSHIAFDKHGGLFGIGVGASTFLYADPSRYVAAAWNWAASLHGLLFTTGGMKSMQAGDTVAPNRGGILRAMWDRNNIQSSPVAEITDKFNTGYQPGAITGDAKLALAESSADLSSLTGIAYGPELITRGSFDKIAGWVESSATSQMTYSITAEGRLRGTVVASPNLTVNQSFDYSFTTEIGKTYDLTFDLPVAQGLFQANVWQGGALAMNTGYISAGDGKVYRFTATSTSAFVRLNCTASAGWTTGEYFEIDNVSCKEVLGELVPNGKLDQGTTGWVNNTANASVTVVAGRLRVGSTGDAAVGSRMAATQSMPILEGGRRYLFKFDIVTIAGNARPRIGTSHQVFYQPTAGDTTPRNNVTIIYTHPSTDATSFQFGGFNWSAWTEADYIEFDNISVTPLANIDHPELVTNGTFATDTAGWSGAGATLASVGGELEVTTTGSFGRGQQSFPVTIGKTYRLTGSARAGSAGSVFRAGSTLNGYEYCNVISAGVQNIVFIATAATLYLTMLVNSSSVGVTAYFDNISVKEADAGLGANLVTNGTFATDTDWNKSLTTIANGVATFPASANITQDGHNFVAGKVYRVSFDVSRFVSGNITVSFSLVGAMTSINLLGPGVGRHAVYLVGNGNTRLGIASTSGSDFDLDNIEVREVTDSLVVNGTFDTGVEGWVSSSVGAPPAPSWDAGRLKLEMVDSTNIARAHAALSLVVGRRYKVEATHTGITSWLRIGISPGSTSSVNLTNVSGALSAEFVATHATVYLSLAPTYVGIAYFDDVKLTEIPAELVTNGDFAASGSGENTLEGWTTHTTGDGTVIVANGVATLTGGAGTAGITQQLTGLTVGQPYRLKFTVSTGPIDMAVTGLAETTYAVGAHTIEIVPAATSRTLTLSVDAGETAGVTAVSVNAKTGELFSNGTFASTDVSDWLASGDGTFQVVSGQLQVTAGAAFTGAQKQSVGIPGAWYRVSGDLVSGSGRMDVQQVSGGDTGVGQAFYNITRVGPHRFDGLVQANVTTGRMDVRLRSQDAGGVTVWDNFSIVRVAVDRSVAANHPVVYGTVTRTPVASGAEVAAFGGFSTNNHLDLPYTSALDFGTGDFCIMGWAKTNINGTIASRGDGVSAGSWFIQHTAGSTTYMRIHDGAVFQITVNAVLPQGDNVHVIIARRNGAMSIYGNGQLLQTVNNAASALSVTNATGVLRLGEQQHQTYASATQRIALFRISASAPTPDQCRAIYEAERHLFQPNAKALLLGSPNVQALAYDNDNDKLYAATAVGTNVFRGLQRVGYRQSTTGRNKLLNSIAQGGGVDTAPTYWAKTAASALGLNSQIVGAGNGYIDLRIWGTPTRSDVAIFGGRFQTFNVTIAPGENWGVSYSAEVVSGDGSTLELSARMIQYNGGALNGEVIGARQPIPGRIVGYGVLAANTTGITADHVIYVSSLAPIEATIRISQPMLEKATAFTSFEHSLSASDNHKLVAAVDGNLLIGTAAGVDVFMPSVPMRERLLSRKPFAPYDPRTGTHRAVTTDATPTDVLHIPVAEGKAFRFRASVAAAQYGGTATERAAYIVEGIAWRDVGGNVQVSATTTVLSEITSAMDCTAQVNTTAQTLTIRATGKAATRMVWVTRMEMDDLGLMGAA